MRVEAATASAKLTPHLTFGKLTIYRLHLLGSDYLVAAKSREDAQRQAREIISRKVGGN